MKYLVIAEKPNVSRAIAKVIGAYRQEDGYLEGGDCVVSWCLGHLAEYAAPEHYDERYENWRFEDLIESEILMEERKAEYFAALMLLGNLMPYFEGLKDMDFQAKAFQCMNAFQAPYKAVLISLYESAVKNGNTAIAEEVKENFDVQVEDIAQRFRDLGLDDSLVQPSYVVNVSPLQEKINKTIRNEPEVEYHKDNEAFLKTVLSEFKMLTGEADA